MYVDMCTDSLFVLQRMVETPHLHEDTWSHVTRALEKASSGDPCLVIQWNLNRLADVDATLQQPAVHAQLVAAGLGHAGSTREAVLSFIYDHGGERIGPATASESIVFFREPSIMGACKRELAAALPFAHVLSPVAAASLNPPGPAIDRIALPFVIYKTERVKPDIDESEFFYM